jgi:phosphatidylserine synthase
VNYAFLFLVICGVVVFLARARTTARERQAETFAGFALLLAAGASVALYVPTLVESRFAAPAELLLTPFLVVALESAGRWRAERRWSSLATAAFLAVVFVAGAARLSAWIAAQAPRLAAPHVRSALWRTPGSG